MHRVIMVGLDTAKGRTLEIMKSLYSVGQHGLTVYGVAKKTSQNKDSELTFIRFLRKIDAVTNFKKKRAGGVGKELYYKLTDPIMRLFSSIDRELEEYGVTNVLREYFDEYVEED